MTEKNSKTNSKENNVNIFEKEISRLPAEMKEKLLAKEKIFKDFVKIINKKAAEKSMGIYMTHEVEMKNNMPVPNLDKLTLKSSK